MRTKRSGKLSLVALKLSLVGVRTNKICEVLEIGQDALNRREAAPPRHWVVLSEYEDQGFSADLSRIEAILSWCGNQLNFEDQVVSQTVLYSGCEVVLKEWDFSEGDRPH